MCSRNGWDGVLRCYYCHNHNEDSVSAEPRQGIVVVNKGSTSASYVEVEDYREDVLKLDAGK